MINRFISRAVAAVELASGECDSSTGSPKPVTRYSTRRMFRSFWKLPDGPRRSLAEGLRAGVCSGDVARLGPGHWDWD